jgi:hypothetical protein
LFCFAETSTKILSSDSIFSYKICLIPLTVDSFSIFSEVTGGVLRHTEVGRFSNVARNYICTKSTPSHNKRACENVMLCNRVSQYEMFAVFVEEHGGRLTAESFSPSSASILAQAPLLVNCRRRGEKLPLLHHLLSSLSP